MPKINSAKINSARKRAKNYTLEEEMCLVELVENHCAVIENKKSDAVVWRQKQKAWQKIESGFAATIGLHRHWKNLREKYEMMRRKAKQEIAELKVDKGGGVPSAKISAPTLKIAAMLGYSVTALQTDCDNDSYIVIDDLNDEDMVYFSEDPNLSSAEFVKAGTSQECNNLTNWKPINLDNIKSQELAVGKKRSMEEEKMKLIFLQQKFYKNEDSRAQEKHEQELISLKLKNEILQLELEEKKSKKCNFNFFLHKE